MTDPVVPTPGATPAPNVPRKTYTPEERDQVVALSRDGMGNKEIAVTLNLHGHIVNSIVNGARRQGQLPPTQKTLQKIQMGTSATLEAPPQNNPAPYLENSRMSKPAPRMASSMQPAPAPSVADDFTGGKPIIGSPGGFTGERPLVKYTVERLSPPDGVLGTHHGSFSLDELGRTYGAGYYQITKHEPGKAMAVQFTQQISQSYGETRFPNNMGSQRPTPQRTFPGFGRPPMSGPSNNEEGSAPPYRPMYPRQDGERNIIDFARHTAAQTNSGLDKAIEMMGQLQIKALENAENARRASPEVQMTKFMETQQELMNQRYEQERQRQLERQTAEEAKYERTRREDRERWERDQDAARIAHDRELARIKTEAETRLAESRAISEERERRDRQEREDRDRRGEADRKHFLEIEEKRMQLMREDAEHKQKRLEIELQRSREEMMSLQLKTTEELKENREATAKHIEESNRSLGEQLERDRESLDREHKLKEKAQDREFELQKEMISLQRENVEKSGGDQIFSTIQTVIKEFSKGLEKVVDLKKIEAMTPEAQAVAASRGAMDGAVMNAGPTTANIPNQQQSAPQQNQPQEPAQQQQAPAPVSNAASIVTGIVENKMESMIRESLRKPFFQEVLKEWALHVDESQESGKVDATTFANLYMVMMQDAKNEEGRQGCAAFATFMKPRNWKKMYAVLKTAMDEETQQSFEKPAAAEFYEQFRAIVITHIRDYFEQFMADKVKNGQPAPAQQQAPAPVEPQGAPAQSQEEDAPAVPTRESLRAAADAAQGA